MRRTYVIRTAALALCLVTLLTLLGGCSPADGSTPDVPMDVENEGEGSVTTDGQGELKYLSDQPSSMPEFPSDGKTYVAYVVNDTRAGRIVGGAMQCVSEDGKTARVGASANLGYRFVGWSDGVTTAKREGDTAAENTVLTAIFDVATSDFPAVMLTTATGKDVTSKTEYIGGTISVLNADARYEMDDRQMQIRGRGNYTWSGMEKKAYKLKFTEKTALLGVGKAAKTWVLLSNMCDQTLLRN